MTLEDVGDEAARLAASAVEAGLPLKLFGGVAIWLTCPSAREAPLKRAYADIDFVTLSRARSSITRFFESQGYAGDRLFNALHGAQRLIFVDRERGRPVDVIIDRFTMCHTIDLRDRLLKEGRSVPVTDLLLTKLQVVELNDKDLRDILALLADHPVEVGSTNGIDTARIAELTRDDWGLEHTMRRTLAIARESVNGFGLSRALTEVIGSRIDALTAFLDTAPKSVRWRLRAQVGERLRWYELPEEARR